MTHISKCEAKASFRAIHREPRHKESALRGSGSSADSFFSFWPPDTARVPNPKLLEPPKLVYMVCFVSGQIIQNFTVDGAGSATSSRDACPAAHVRLVAPQLSRSWHFFTPTSCCYVPCWLERCGYSKSMTPLGSEADLGVISCCVMSSLGFRFQQPRKQD